MRNSWHSEFSRVIGCNRCSINTDRNLLRDDAENVPQPGWIGKHYGQKRVLLIGQNPGTPKSLAQADLPYTTALRHLRDIDSPEVYEKLVFVLRGFIPKWPVHGTYFPLTECSLTLDDIAYFNLVRCRTLGDKSPGNGLVENCISAHFIPWLQALKPRVVIFIGKWAADRGGPLVAAQGIPFGFMNRQRSLSSNERIANRNLVIKLVLETKD